MHSQIVEIIYRITYGIADGARGVAELPGGFFVAEGVGILKKMEGKGGIERPEMMEMAMEADEREAKVS